MESILTIALPESVSQEDVDSLRKELAAIDGILREDAPTQRSVGAAIATLWALVAPEVAKGAAAALVAAVVNLLRRKNIDEATLTIGDVKVVVKNVSVEELARLEAALRATLPSASLPPKKQKTKR